MRTRGFEIVSKYKDKDISLPTRKTKYSAGYDIATAENVDLLPLQVTLVLKSLKT